MKKISSKLKSVWLALSTILVYTLALLSVAFSAYFTDHVIKQNYGVPGDDWFLWFYVAIGMTCALGWSFMMTLARKEMNVLRIIGMLMGLVAGSIAFVSFSMGMFFVMLAPFVRALFHFDGMNLLAGYGGVFTFYQWLPGVVYLAWIICEGFNSAYQEARCKQACTA